MSNEQHWGDTEFGYRLGIAVVILAVGVAASFVLSGLSELDPTLSEKPAVTQPKDE